MENNIVVPRWIFSPKSMYTHRSFAPYKTKFCVNGGWCEKNGCTFAHSLDEIQLPMCRYGKNCFNKYCIFYHEGDDCIPSQKEYALDQLRIQKKSK